MSASDLSPFFDERLGEIEEYLGLLEEIERAARSGPPKLQGSSHTISAPQQKILYSSVYLQLYNLVEATVTRCIDETSAAASTNGQWHPEDLNDALRKEWVRAMARTHVDLTPERRLKQAIRLCEHIFDRLPVDELAIERSGGGNWDDITIEKICKRVGCPLRIGRSVREAVKRSMRDDLGALRLVKNRRNGLAHGSLSFVECADGLDIEELRRTTEVVASYLREVIRCFTTYIESLDFLSPERKAIGVQ
jgi:hypothetical protein